MASSRSSSTQLPPLNPGSVVSAALRLYRDRFKDYLKLSAIAHLWILAGIAVLSLLAGIFMLAFIFLGNDILVPLGAFLGICLGLFPLFYGVARYLLLSAVISRLAYKDVISQPETTAHGQQATSSQLWSFFVLNLLLVLIYIAAYIAAIIVALLIVLPVGVVSGIISGLTTPEVGTMIGFLLGALVGFLAVIAVLLWVIARVFISETIMAVESNINSPEAISRSFQLTQSIVLRVIVVILAAFLISLPIIIATNYAFQVPILLLPEDSNTRMTLIVLSYVLSFIGNIFLLPFWQVLKGVLYYDLRSRREGLDLQLRDLKLKADDLPN